MDELSPTEISTNFAGSTSGTFNGDLHQLPSYQGPAMGNGEAEGQWIVTTRWRAVRLGKRQGDFEKSNSFVEEAALRLKLAIFIIADQFYGPIRPYGRDRYLVWQDLGSGDTCHYRQASQPPRRLLATRRRQGLMVNKDY